jgi:hypothetical protein
MAEDSIVQQFALARTVPTIEGSMQPLPFDGKKINDADLAKVLDYIPFVTAWFKDAEKEALVRVRKGSDIGGRKMVQGRMKRSWCIKDDAMIQEFIELGLAPDQAFNMKLKSPAQIEASAIPSDVKSAVLDCVVKGRGNDILALKSDHRKAVNSITKAQDAVAEMDVVK